MYGRRPVSLSVRDRFISAELSGDFTDRDIGHLLRKAYLNHKSPFEFNDLKRFIRDVTFGRHNSPYVMYNGSPAPLASIMAVGSMYLSVVGSNSFPDDVYIYEPYVGYTSIRYLNNSSNCSSNNLCGSWSCVPNGNFPFNATNMINYNNGKAINIQFAFSNDSLSSIISSCINTGSTGSIYYVGPGSNTSPEYLYAPYVTSSSPLTLLTYMYWQAPSTSTYSYIYYMLYTPNYNCYGNLIDYWAPIFYSTGSFSFSESTYYITGWQWTYT